MAQKITGMLNLSKIPKELLFTTKHGDKAIFIDIVKKKDGADRYGNEYTICLYDKENRKNIFLGDMKVQEYGNGGSAPASAPASQDEASDDLPFALRPR
jgi:hypothetical protein